MLDNAARTQIRDHAAGRADYDHKFAEGKTHSEALRSLNRQLSDVVYPACGATSTRCAVRRPG